jgi:hypothetical protein
MDCQNIIPLAQILARVIMMSFVSLGAILSIYWGWHLYKNGVQSAVSGEVESRGIALKFVSAGPGIVLAGFGAWLLSTVAAHPAFEYKAKVQGQTSAIDSPMGQVTQGRFMTVAAANKQASDSKAIDTKPAALDSKTAPACTCRAFITETNIKSMGGTAKASPSNEEILQSLEAALAAIRGAQVPGSTIASHTSRTLESLEYLRELAADEVARDQNAKANRKP